MDTHALTSAPHSSVKNADSISLALLRAVGSPEQKSKPSGASLYSESRGALSAEKLKQPSFITSSGLKSSGSTLSGGAWKAKVNNQITKLYSPKKTLGPPVQDSIDDRIGTIHRIPRKNPFGARGSHVSPGAIPPLPADHAHGRPPEFNFSSKQVDSGKNPAFLFRELNAMDSGIFMDDMTRSNCPVCCTISADTCSFCLKTKFSRVPRMHLKELADRLLEETPSLSTRAMVKVLHDYGRSSEIAAAINEHLHYGGHTSSNDPRLYCAKHYDAWGDLEDYAASMELEVENTRSLVKHAHKKLAVAASRTIELKEQKIEYEERGVRLARDYKRLQIEHERHLRETKDKVQLMYGQDATNKQVEEDMAREIAHLRKENKEMKEQLSELLTKVEIVDGDPATEIAELSNQIADLSQVLARTRLELRSKNSEIKTLESKIASSVPLDQSSNNQSTPNEKDTLIPVEPISSDINKIQRERTKLLEELQVLKKTNAPEMPLPMNIPKVCPHCHAILVVDDDRDDDTTDALDAIKVSTTGEKPKTIESIFDGLPPSPEAMEEHIKHYHKLVPLVKYSKENLKYTTTLTVDQSLDFIHDILEKKCIADSRDLEQGNEIESMPEFLSNYFLQTYGLQKMADKKIEEFIGGLYKYHHINDRIAMFMTIIGIRDRSLYSKTIGDLLVRSLMRAYKGNLLTVKDGLDEGPGKCFITRQRAIEVIIGPRTERSKPWEWDAPQFFQIAGAEKIESLLCRIENLPSAKGLDELDLDSVLLLIMECYKEWYFDVQLQLIDAFTLFDLDNNGLELPEFKVMLQDLCKWDHFTEREVCKLWKSMIHRTGAHSGLFEDPCVFAIVCCQHSIFPFIQRPQREYQTSNDSV